MIQILRSDAAQDLLGPEGDLLWAKALIPDPIPKGWRLAQDSLDGGAFVHATGVFVIVSGAREADGERWLHLSLSRRDRIPDWADVRLAKDVFFGDDYAAMIFPPKAFYVNINPRVLHLFKPISRAWPLPEFSIAGITL